MNTPHDGPADTNPADGPKRILPPLDRPYYEVVLATYLGIDPRSIQEFHLSDDAESLDVLTTDNLRLKVPLDEQVSADLVREENFFQLNQQYPPQPLPGQDS